MFYNKLYSVNLNQIPESPLNCFKTAEVMAVLAQADSEGTEILDLFLIDKTSIFFLKINTYAWEAA